MERKMGEHHTGPAIQKGPVEARQVARGRQTLFVLGASLALAVITYFIIHYGFTGTVF